MIIENAVAGSYGAGVSAVWQEQRRTPFLFNWAR